MAREMAFHVDMQTEQHIRAGMPATEARRVALTEFGGTTRWQEAARAELRSLRFEEVVRDIRYAVRALRRNAAFTSVAILILAIGIGASTTIFRLVDTLLLQPPPVADPSHLLEVFNANPAAAAFEQYTPLSYPEYVYFRDRRSAFADLIAFDGDPAFLSWKTESGGKLVQAQFVTANFFSVLGAMPAAGRLFTAADDSASGDNFVAVVSETFWHTRMASARDISGRSLTVNGVPYTIVGVAPRHFTGLMAGLAPEVWLPLSTAERAKHERGAFASRNTFWLIAAGRLRPGTTAEQAQSALGQQLHEFAEGDRELGALRAAVFPTTMIPGPFRTYVAAFVGLLQGLVIMMLVLACANAANLSLAQATTRHAEMGIRSSLGASRGRLVQQLLTESLVLASLAGVAGMGVAWLITPLVLRLVPATLPVRLAITAGWRVPVFTAVLALVSGLALGWIPARRATGALVQSLRAGAARHRSRLRNALVVVQVAV